MRTALRELNGLAPVLHALQSADASTQRAAMGALVNLSVNKPNKDTVRTLGGLPVIMGLFQVRCRLGTTI